VVDTIYINYYLNKAVKNKIKLWKESTSMASEACEQLTTGKWLICQEGTRHNMKSNNHMTFGNFRGHVAENLLGQ